jgi:NAD(P)-dependent dehydrogenase (short-subunit alcohol dehydrogenase family)
MVERRVAIVTGAARGIGLATAQLLAEAGNAVAAVDVDGDPLAAAPLPDATLRLVRDVADDPNGWVAETEQRLGPVAILVNNAASMDGRSFLELPMDAVRRSLGVTLLGSWALTRAVVDRMVAAGIPGAVVFTLSLHAKRVRFCPDYSVAKAGLAMLVAELANELGPHGIRVNAVSPGVVVADAHTDGTPAAAAHRAASEALVPLGRLGDPGDVARAIAFLADPGASGYVTGANLVVDGGLDQSNWLHHLYGSAAAERSRAQSTQHD